MHAKKSARTSHGNEREKKRRREFKRPWEKNGRIQPNLVEKRRNQTGKDFYSSNVFNGQEYL